MGFRRHSRIKTVLGVVLVFKKRLASASADNDSASAAVELVLRKVLDNVAVLDLQNRAINCKINGLCKTRKLTLQREFHHGATLAEHQSSS